MNDPEDRTVPYWWQSVAPSAGSGGLLGALGRSARPRGLLSQFDPPDEAWDRSVTSWVDSTMPFGRTSGIPGLPMQPGSEPWLTPWPENLGSRSRTGGGNNGWLAMARKAAEPITSYPETYSQMNREAREQMAHGIDQIRRAYEPGPRDPIGFVAGLGNVGLGALGYVSSPISAGLRTIAGKPWEEATGIPKEYTEFALSLGIPGLGLRSAWSASRPVGVPRVAAPGGSPSSVWPLADDAVATRAPVDTSQGLRAEHVAAPPTISDRLFDYSRLNKTPDVPQFELPRYVPPRGVPERVEALASPDNIARVNAAVGRGANQGGLAFYNTGPLREAFIAELGTARGEAAYEKYLNLVGATSPRARIGENIRNASYHYKQSEQALPAPIPRWDGRRWVLDEPLPPPWGHIEQGLHAKKVREVLEQGGLAPLTNPKIASFVQNLRGNQMPVTIDRHNVRQWGVVNTSGRPVDAPPETGYGFLERLQQGEAARMGITPAQYQASGWIGGARQTGVRSRLAPWLDTFETRVALTAKERGLSKEETLRRFIRGELALRSLGGAGATVIAAQHELEEGDE